MNPIRQFLNWKYHGIFIFLCYISVFLLQSGVISYTLAHYTDVTGNPVTANIELNVTSLEYTAHRVIMPAWTIPLGWALTSIIGFLFGYFGKKESQQGGKS